jgi:hypothetical protein
MPLLVTSAAGINGDGYGALLAFDRSGRPLGAFSTDARIADPRWLAVDQKKELLFLNSGSDRVLALDRHGTVVATGQLTPSRQAPCGVLTSRPILVIIQPYG